MMKRRLQVLQMEEDKARAEVDAEAADCDAVAEQVHAAILRTHALEVRVAWARGIRWRVLHT